ncbi:hypothetical protein ACTID9_23975 [Brevibacillus fluminis]|uniref:hypothetical protein n=1 Tax=Brevibacillus fluminis TaxID=511487 RepID=UPI003F88CF2A
MDPSMSNNQVLERIRTIQAGGGSLAKKAVKAADPELMRNALFYFPSWDNAIQAATN